VVGGVLHTGEDIPFHRALARAFTICDRYRLIVINVHAAAMVTTARVGLRDPADRVTDAGYLSFPGCSKNVPCPRSFAAVNLL
jgi:hypothetical protein